MPKGDDKAKDESFTKKIKIMYNFVKFQTVFIYY